MKHKFIFHTMPNHPFPIKPLVQGISWTILSKTRKNRKGEPMGIGKIVYKRKGSKEYYIILCYDEECSRYFSSR